MLIATGYKQREVGLGTGWVACGSGIRWTGLSGAWIEKQVRDEGRRDEGEPVTGQGRRRRLSHSLRFGDSLVSFFAGGVSSWQLNLVPSCSPASLLLDLLQTVQRIGMKSYESSILPSRCVMSRAIVKRRSSAPTGPSYTATSVVQGKSRSQSTHSTSRFFLPISRHGRVPFIDRLLT
jgi:hypothetical protein